MSTVISEELVKWFDEFQAIPPEAHLLCPKIDDDDCENYRVQDDPDSIITREEKEKRIEAGNTRINITYWNSLIFGFDKKDAGKWLGDFTRRLDACLKSCSECVLNWHMRRKPQLQRFLERWDEEAVAQIQDLLNGIDKARIDENLTWAKNYILAIKTPGATFKKSEFGDNLGNVLINVYEALCCMEYLGQRDQRAVFQFVFMHLQGKTYLKLGTKDPLPGMTNFLFDHKNEDRRKWAHENWKNIPISSLTAPQFEWAIHDSLVIAVEETWRKDLNQPTPEQCLEIEQFWCGFEDIVRTLPASLIASHVRNLEVSKSIFELLFAHIQYCRSEGVLVVIIRILTVLLEKAPNVIWDVIAGARPNVIADLLFGSPIYKGLLRQSLENCWGGSSTDSVPFPTSWIAPWLKSIGRDQRYDACEVLMHTLFERLVKDPSIGEPGQAACMRAGFDALAFTLNTFLDAETSSATSTVRLYINSAFNLMTKYKDLIIQQINPPKKQESIEGWATFKVADSAHILTEAAMKLDMKLFDEEYHVIHSTSKFESTVPRNSKEFWTAIIEMYEASNDRVKLSKHILFALAPICAVEQIRERKAGGKLDQSIIDFNESLKSTADTVGKIIGRIGDLDVMELNSLFIERAHIQVIIALSVHDESDLAESAAEVLKGWTAEDTRTSAIEQLAQLHTEQTLASAVWSLDRVLKPPYPWGPIRPLLNANRSILRGLAEASSGVLRGGKLDSRQAATVLRWWNEQWRFVSKSCLNIESWSHYVPNAIMTEYCREIMEYAGALIAEDGLLTSATALGRSEADMMVKILAPAKDNFRGMEMMIRLKDLWLVDVTVQVLCKILKRLRENDLEINAGSRKQIVDACTPTATGKYLRSTNLSNQQRAELLQALGSTDDDVQIIHVSKIDAKSSGDKIKKQSRLDAWSKSGSSSPSTSASSSVSKPSSNRQDVLELSKSLNNPILKAFEAKQKAKAKGPDLKAISAIKESRQREKAEKAKRDAEAIAKAKQLRGEPIGGPAGRSEIMVNSSDEESEDSDDGDEGNQLAMISTDGKQSIDEEEKRRLKALRDMTRRPIKKIRQQRSVKEMRARLIPPMDKLHSAILAWDIFHDGNDPPNGPKAGKVDTSYIDPASYRDTFFPLLASEAWNSFVTAKNEVTAQAFGIKIATRASVDSFLEVTFTIEVAQNRERGIGEGDILLVSEDESPLNKPTARHCLARVHRLTYKKDRLEIIFRVASRGNPLAAILMPNTMMYGIKITNMITVEREYAALESLQYYDLMDEILKAEPSPILKYGDERIANYESNWQLNRGQALSVLGAQENDGFTLIQGPPGTGKTKTIIAMVGALLSEQLAQASGKGTPVGVPVRPGATTQQAGQRSKKLLVCAPSNAAVDELVTRLKNGIKTTSGKPKTINVVRLGRTDAISAAVKDVTLDELVRVRMQGDSTKDKAKADREKLHERAGQIKEELSILRPKLDQANEKEDQEYRNRLLRQFDELKREQRDIGKQIEADKDSGNSVAREVEMKRRQIQQEILNNAHVLCATLSGSGHEMFRNLDVEFETVIIDEAAQCVELSALIPLKYGCCKCILVGDPKQLPPTVLSQSAARFGYNQSLFVRMQQNHPKSVHLLDRQYRMHPEISLFPSKEFYEGQLRDGQDMAGLRQQPWHQSALLGPYRFFDVQGVQERGRRGQSLVNTRELDVALQMYERFSKDYGETNNLVGKIGIITPYKAQLYELRNRFRARYGEEITDIIEFNTTDAFQGRECEIIIFSCVRASPTGGIGFMTDIRRMNVGLTRAKSSLWILGDSRALVQGEFWKKLIEDARSRDRYTQGDILNMFRRPLEKAKPGSIMTSAAPTPVDSPMAAGSPASMATTDGDVAMPDAYQAEPEKRAEIPTRPSASTPGLPPIQTSAPAGDNKKRAMNSPDGAPPVPKRIASDKPRAGGLAGKFGQRPNRPPPKPPTDPSAMVTLGLAPPERPPAPKPSVLPTEPSVPSGPSGLSSEPSMAPSRPRPPLNVMRKKAKPSLFMPKRR